MSNSNSWNLENLHLSEDKINKNIKEISKQIKQDVNFILNLVKKYDSLALLKFVAFHTDEVLEKSKTNKNIHNEEVAYSQLLFILKFVASNPNKFGSSKDLTDFSWKKFNRNYSNFENHLIKYTDNLILKENVDSSVRSRMQEKFYSYMFPIPRTKFENISSKKKQLKLLLQPYVDKINGTFNSGLDNVLDSLELMAKVGTKGIYDLNQDCDLFAKRSQSKMEELKLSGTQKTNKELLEQIISEEGWQNWINNLQSRSENLDLFDVKKITKMGSDELEMLSIDASSQYSDNFCWLTESAGLDNSLFIKINERYYSFDGMFIFDKAYQAIKKAVIKKFPSYENTWNSIEKEKSGLLPVSIFAGVFGHFTYSLNYEVENSFFTALFENEKNDVYVQVPMQQGYNVPLNPIREIVITEYALKSYDLSLKDFNKIDSPIIVVDSLDEKTDKILVEDNIYYISYTYLASILNDWNEIRMLRDTILGASPENIEKKEVEQDEPKSKVYTSKEVRSIVEDNLEETKEIENPLLGIKSQDKEEDTDEELEYLEELFDEEIEKKEIEHISEEQIESSEDSSEETHDSMNDLFMDNIEESNQSLNDEKFQTKEMDDSSKESNKAFSFFDVLNNVAQGKEPLGERNESFEEELIDEIIEDKLVGDKTESHNRENKTKCFSMTDVLNNVAKGKQPLETLEPVKIDKSINSTELDKVDESTKGPAIEEAKLAGFSFFDVLNNVASGKDPLTGEEDLKISKTDEIFESDHTNKVEEANLNYAIKPVDLEHIENLLDDEDDDFIDEEEIAESVEVERSDDDLRAMFDDDSNDEREFLSDYLLSDIEMNSIVEPEDEDEEVQEAPIDDIIISNEKMDLDNEYVDKTLKQPIEVPINEPYNSVATVDMMNSVSEILAKIDDSDLDEYGITDLEDEEDLEYEDVHSDETEEHLSYNLSDNNEKFEEKITENPKNININFIAEEEIKVVAEEKSVPFEQFSAIENNRIIEEEIPTIESLWPSSIIDIVGMSDKLDDSPFFNICKANDVELLNAIDYLIGKALDSQKVDGKDKMFTLPESNLSIVLPTNKNDQLKKWERMNSLGALMYSKDMDIWNALTLTYDESKELKAIREWSLTKDSYSPVDWKFVVTTGSRLKKKNKK